MPVTATIRELRNQFPKVRKLLEAEGEVVITEQGAPLYRLIRHAPASTRAPSAKDYMARLRRYQPRPIGVAAARALHEANRGDR